MSQLRNSARAIGKNDLELTAFEEVLIENEFSGMSTL